MIRILYFILSAFSAFFLLNSCKSTGFILNYYFTVVFHPEETEENQEKIEKFHEEKYNLPKFISAPQNDPSEVIRSLKLILRPNKAYYNSITIDSSEPIINNITILVGLKNTGLKPILIDKNTSFHSWTNTITNGFAFQMGLSLNKLSFMDTKTDYRMWAENVSPHNRLQLIQPGKMWVTRYSLSNEFMGFEKIQNKHIYVKAFYHNEEPESVYFGKQKRKKNTFNVWRGTISSNIAIIRIR
jgi:hypothetical protein